MPSPPAGLDEDIMIPSVPSDFEDQDPPAEELVIHESFRIKVQSEFEYVAQWGERGRVAGSRARRSVARPLVCLFF